MKIQLLSDTHGFDYYLDDDADVIVHAGDFGNGLKDAILFAEKCQDLNKDFVFVLGNHDYYDGNVESIEQFLLEKYPQNFLTVNHPIQIQEHTFVGGTLFSNFRANTLDEKYQEVIKKSQQIAQDFIYDFKKITIGENQKFITPDDFVSYFNACFAFISQYKNQDNVIVVTHFPPHLACLDPYWSKHPTGSLLNPYFINDVDVSGFKLWLCGHTHTAVNTVVDGCRIVINPLGYAQEHGNNGFQYDLMVQI